MLLVHIHIYIITEIPDILPSKRQKRLVRVTQSALAFTIRLAIKFHGH